CQGRFASLRYLAALDPVDNGSLATPPGSVSSGRLRLPDHCPVRSAGHHAENSTLSTLITVKANSRIHQIRNPDKPHKESEKVLIDYPTYRIVVLLENACATPMRPTPTPPTTTTAMAVMVICGRLAPGPPAAAAPATPAQPTTSHDYAHGGEPRSRTATHSATPTTAPKQTTGGNGPGSAPM